MIEMDEKIAAKDIKVGYLLDFQNDPIADAPPTTETTRNGFEFELCLVGGVRQHGNSIMIYTDAVNCAFPPDHLIRVCGREEDAEEF